MRHWAKARWHKRPPSKQRCDLADGRNTGDNNAICTNSSCYSSRVLVPLSPHVGALEGPEIIHTAISAQYDTPSFLPPKDVNSHRQSTPPPCTLPIAYKWASTIEKKRAEKRGRYPFSCVLSSHDLLDYHAMPDEGTPTKSRAKPCLRCRPIATKTYALASRERRRAK